jgi:PAS domain S-box-containing protein
MKPRGAQTIPENTQPQTKVSFMLMLATLGTYLIVGVISLNHHDWKTVWSICGGSIALAVPYWLLRSGRVRSGNLILTIIVFASVTIIATVGQGIHDLAVVAYPIIFIYVGLTSGRAILGVCGGLTFVALIWLALGESFGWFVPVPLFRDPLNLLYLSVLTVLLAITALAVDLLSSNLRKTIALAHHEIDVRRQAEQALKDSNELFSQFLLHSPIYAYIKEVTPAKSRVIQASENFKDMIGIRGSEMTGKAMEELFPPEFAAKITADDWAVVSSGSMLELAENLNGRHYSTLKFPISQRGKKYLAGFTMDITERKQAEDLLRQEEERYRLMFESAPLAINITRGTDIIYANPNYLKVFGFSSLEELKRYPPLDLFAPESRPQITENIQRRAQGLFVPDSYETVCVRNDGTRFPVLLYMAKAVFADGPAMVAFIMDISERKRAESERERLMSAIEQIVEVVVVTDLEGRIQYVNPAFETVTGYSREEALGQNPRILKSGKHDNQFYEELWQTISSGKSWKGTLVNKRKDGKLHTEEATISPVFDGGGRIVSYVAVKRDLSAQRSMEDQLRQAQKMETVGQLAGGVAHDFNNMLQVISSYVEMSLGKVAAGQPIHKYLLEVRRAAQRSAEITGQLLAFARKQTVSPKVLDLNDAVEGARKMIQRLIGEDIDLVWLPGHELWMVKIDPAQIDQVLANLAVNARDAIGGVGKLTVRTEKVALDEAYCAAHAGFLPGEYVLLAVSDDGHGMNKETMAHLFEPFFTTKGPGKGTGLGLATTYGIIKQNSGSINVDSAPGEGTTFKIYLPRAEGTTAAGLSESQAAPPRGGTETFLLVEDEAAILELAKERLQQLGYTVLTARSPEEAIRSSEGYSGPIQLLITDVVMPQMNGRQLAERLIAQRPALKCLYMSGYTGDVIAHRGVLEEGVSFIAKPFSLTTLAEKVRSVLEG